MTVENVLTPRVDLVAVDIKSSHEDILDVIQGSTHSRLPVDEGSIDNIIGILQIRKYIKAYLREGLSLDIRPLLDEVFFVHQSTNIDELLPVMSKRKHNLAVVTDNYGGTLGIVTVEDIVEELVGEIWDEEDVVEEPVLEIEPGVFLVDGRNPSATPSSASATRTRRRTRAWSTRSWASGHTSSSPSCRAPATALPTTASSYGWSAWSTTASSSCA